MPKPEILLISWSFTEPSVTISINGARWTYRLVSPSIIDQILLYFNRGWTGKALAHAKRYKLSEHRV